MSGVITVMAFLYGYTVLCAVLLFIAVEIFRRWSMPLITELCLCESVHLIAQSGRLYRYTVEQGCELCESIHREYDAPEKRS